MNRRPAWRNVWVVTWGCCLLLAGSAWADYSTDDSPVPTIPVVMNPTLVARTYPLNPSNRYLDGNWLSNTIASDGKVYSGSSTHAEIGSAIFFQYDPASQNINMLSSDIRAVCGGAAVSPQGKLHSFIKEMDGWLYFTTHLADYSTSGQNNFTGAHLLRYQLGSREAGSPVVQNVGQIKYNYTNYAGISVDPNRNYVYVTATRWWNGNGGALIRYNMNNGTKTELASWGAAEGDFQFLDQRGDMWFSHSGANGTLFKVTGATGAVTSYPDVIPYRRNLTSNTQNGSNTYRWWNWGAEIDGNRALFGMIQDGGLWEFDANKAQDGNPSDAFRLVKWVGARGGGTALSTDKDTVYYIQSGDPNWTNGTKAYDHHLKSFDLADPNTTTDWGRIVDQDGRTLYRGENMSADADGTVYFTGDWRIHVNPTEHPFATVATDGAPLFPAHTPDPVNYRSLRRINGTYGDYIDLWRGEMFSVIQAPEPVSLTLLLAGAGLLLARRRRA